MGGHFRADGNADPWPNVYYQSSGGTATAPLHSVDTGEPYSNTEGRAFVVHNSQGQRVTCALINKTETVYDLETLGTYPGYTGTSILGSVKVGFLDDQVSMAYDLDQVDTSCNAPSANVDTACGMRIHAGESCVSDSFVGAVFGSSWSGVKYESVGVTASGAAKTNIGQYSVAGKAFVMYNSAGQRISCALLGKTETVTTITSLGTYPGYTGDAIQGTVSLGFVDTKVNIAFSLTSAASQCLAPLLGVANSCGYKIFNGSSCVATSHVGTQFSTSNAWAGKTYTQTSTATVDFGYGYDDVVGKILVLYDRQGNPATCALIDKQETLTSLSVFDGGYSSLSVNIGFRDTKAAIVYDLSGLGSVCSTPTSADGCTLQLRNVTDCGYSGSLGAAFTSKSTNVWQAATYGSLTGSMEVDYGYDYAASAGKSFAVFNASGAMVTCSLIDAYEFRPFSGQVEMRFTGTSVTFTTALQNAVFRIHSGESCVTAGGHFFATASDPWVSPGATVEFGYGYAASVGRAVVLYTNGAQAQCQLIAVPETVEQINDLGVYPSWNDTAANGSLTLGFRQTHVTIKFHLSLSQGSFSILSGDSCLDHTLAGSPLFSMASDPWAAAGFSAHNGTLVVESGKTYAQVAGRPFVVADSSGARVTCNIIGGATVVNVTALAAMAGYSGNVPTGFVELEFIATEVRLFFNFESGCAPMHVANSCGFAITTGTSCLAAGLLGTPFYATATNPWTAKWSHNGEVEIASGKTYSEITGHAFIMYNSAGEVMSCQLIGREETTFELAVLDVPQGYTGPTVSGFVSFAFVETGVSVSYDLKGVDGACTSPRANTPMSCAMAIYSGTSCASLGSPFYNSTFVSANPWSNVVYTASGTNAQGVVSYVNIGWDYANTQGRVFVIHDSFGNATGCVGVSPPVPPTPYPEGCTPKKEVPSFSSLCSAGNTHLCVEVGELSTSCLNNDDFWYRMDCESCKEGEMKTEAFVILFMVIMISLALLAALAWYFCFSPEEEDELEEEADKDELETWHEEEPEEFHAGGTPRTIHEEDSEKRTQDGQHKRMGGE